jgi:effector-binding domain-containing protein
MSKVKLEKRKPITIAYLRYTGPYGEIPFDGYIGRLYGWAKEKKVRPGFYPMAIFHDDPRTTPPEECRADIAIPVAGTPKGSDEVMVRGMPAMTVATISHKGSGGEYAKTYSDLERWVEENGYDWDGPPIEIYTRKPKVVDGNVLIQAKVMAPVKKK